MPDCSAPANITEWTNCHAEAVVSPVLVTVELIVGCSVTLAVVVAGTIFVRRVVRMFAG